MRENARKSTLKRAHAQQLGALSAFFCAETAACLQAYISLLKKKVMHASLGSHIFISLRQSLTKIRIFTKFGMVNWRWVFAYMKSAGNY